MLGKRLGVAVAVAVLTAALVGPGLTARAAGRAVLTRTVVVPAAAFTPMNDWVSYTKDVVALQTESGPGTFYAPVYFEAPSVKILRVSYYAVDAGGGNLILALYRTRPGTGVTQQMGEVYTVGASSIPQEVTLSDLSVRWINGAFGAVLMVHLPGPDIYKFIGARVTYSYEAEA